MSNQVLLNETTLRSELSVTEKHLMNSVFAWHKIYIQNGLEYSRNYVLETLMSFVSPEDFIPVQYRKEGEHTCFLLKNCGPALTAFWSHKFSVPHEKSSVPFKLAILLGYATDIEVDVQKSIKACLKKRYNDDSKTLNLSAFHNDPDLTEYCSLSQPKLLYFVLHLSLDLVVNTLILNDNRLHTLQPLIALSGNSSVTSLHVRNNKLTTFHALSAVSGWPIFTLNIEGNPLCDNYTVFNYVAEVRRLFPQIRFLDNIPLQPYCAVPMRRNFLCDGIGFELVDQFIEHYFTIYDSGRRYRLEQLYHTNAILSVTAHHFQSHQNFSFAQLDKYLPLSRNIKNSSIAEAKLFCGPKDIIKRLLLLPKSQHDPFSFTIDLMYNTAKCSIIVVNGVLREPGATLLDPDRINAFYRTFVLEAMPSSNQYHIINDQLSVFNPTGSMLNKAFKHVREKETSEFIKFRRAITYDDMDSYVDALMRISHLNEGFARKCLQQTKYDLKKSIELFHKLYKADKFPITAFLSDESVAQLMTTPYHGWKQPARPQIELRSPDAQKNAAPAIPILEISRTCSLPYDPFSGIALDRDVSKTLRRRSRSPSQSHSPVSKRQRKDSNYVYSPYENNNSYRRSNSVEIIGESADCRKTRSRSKSIEYLGETRRSRSRSKSVEYVGESTIHGDGPTNSRRPTLVSPQKNEPSSKKATPVALVKPNASSSNSKTATLVIPKPPTSFSNSVNLLKKTAPKRIVTTRDQLTTLTSKSATVPSMNSKPASSTTLGQKPINSSKVIQIPITPTSPAPLISSIPPAKDVPLATLGPSNAVTLLTIPKRIVLTTLVPIPNTDPLNTVTPKPEYVPLKIPNVVPKQITSSKQIRSPLTANAISSNSAKPVLAPVKSETMDLNLAQTARAVTSTAVELTTKVDPLPILTPTPTHALKVVPLSTLLPKWTPSKTAQHLPSSSKVSTVQVDPLTFPKPGQTPLQTLTPTTSVTPDSSQPKFFRPNIDNPFFDKVTMFTDSSLEKIQRNIANIKSQLSLTEFINNWLSRGIRDPAVWIVLMTECYKKKHILARTIRKHALHLFADVEETVLDIQLESIELEAEYGNIEAAFSYIAPLMKSRQHMENEIRQYRIMEVFMKLLQRKKLLGRTNPTKLHNQLHHILLKCPVPFNEKYDELYEKYKHIFSNSPIKSSVNV